jgi:PAS domain-containing protein
VPQACPRFRSSGRKADAALARWSTMFLRRKFSPGFSRAVNRLLRSRSGVRHATGAPPSPDAATTMEKLDAALNNMSHGLCMFGPDNRLLLWNDRYVKMYRLAPDCLRVGCTLDEMLEALRWNRTRRLNFWCDAFS